MISSGGVDCGGAGILVADFPTAKVRADVQNKMRAVLPAASDAAVKTKFGSTEKLTSGYGWAMRIYTLVDHELRSGCNGAPETRQTELTRLRTHNQQVTMAARWTVAW